MSKSSKTNTQAELTTTQLFNDLVSKQTHSVPVITEGKVVSTQVSKPVLAVLHDLDKSLQHDSIDSVTVDFKTVIQSGERIMHRIGRQFYALGYDNQKETYKAFATAMAKIYPAPADMIQAGLGSQFKPFQNAMKHVREGRNWVFPKAITKSDIERKEKNKIVAEEKKQQKAIESLTTGEGLSMALLAIEATVLEMFNGSYKQNGKIVATSKWTKDVQAALVLIQTYDSMRTSAQRKLEQAGKN